MIKINLLPVELRQVEVKKSNLNLKAILLGIFFLSLLIALGQLFAFIGTRGKLSHLNSEMEQLLQPSKESDGLNQQINGKLLPQKKFLDSNILSSYFMAQMMNLLSDVLPDTLWLSDLSMRREKESVRIELTGYSRITSKQIAVAQIQEYVNTAKAAIEDVLAKSSKDEKAGFEVKAVLTTSLKEISGVEVMQFSTSFKSTTTTKVK